MAMEEIVSFAIKSKLNTSLVFLVSGGVGLAVGQYDVNYGAASMLIMYLCLSVMLMALGKLKRE